MGKYLDSGVWITQADGNSFETDDHRFIIRRANGEKPVLTDLLSNEEFRLEDLGECMKYADNRARLIRPKTAEAEFKRPVRKVIQFVDIEEYVRSLMGPGMVKDLHATERYTEVLCEKCRGTGLTIQINPYGLSEEPNRTSVPRFRYRHEAFSFCPECYNGIRLKCNYCGSLLPRGMLRCSCAKQKELDREEEVRKEKKALDEAPVMPDEEATRERLFFSDAYPYNGGYFTNWDEFFDAWDNAHEPDEPRPEYVWPTEESRMELDAERIVEDACDDLDEDAYDRVSSDIPELQGYMDKWLDAHGTSSYVESHRAKVRVPWERYREDER